MSTKNDYSTEEWKAIAAAPVVAGLFITLSDVSGLVGTTKEAMAVGRAITESAASTAPEVVKSVAESVRSAGGRPVLPDIP
jgi:alkylated DNA nucleotide flippase Atl1